MHTIIVKQGFAVTDAFYYNVCLFRNCVTILKVVGSEDCVQENKLPLWGPGEKSQPLGNSCNFFGKKLAILITFCTFLEQSEKTKLL